MVVGDRQSGAGLLAPGSFRQCDSTSKMNQKKKINLTRLLISGSHWGRRLALPRVQTLTTEKENNTQLLEFKTVLFVCGCVESANSTQDVAAFKDARRLF